MPHHDCQREVDELKEKYRALELLYRKSMDENHQKEEQLAQMRNNYEAFFNTIPEFLFVLNNQGNIIHVNSTVIDRLGYSWEELEGKSVLTVHPEERRAEAGRIVMEMLEGVAECCPVPVITRKGIQIPVETRVTKGIWNGEPVIFGVTKDISELRLSEEKFSKLFHMSPFASGLIALDNQQYLEVNDAFFSLFGFTHEEVIGKTALELGILGTDARVEILKHAGPDGKVSHMEADLKTKSGDIRHVMLFAENIYVQDKRYRFTVVLDLTDLKNAEEIIRRKNAELEMLNRQKDKLFSIFAHDLGGPFNAIYGYSELMNEQVKAKNYTTVERYADTIHQSSIRIITLLSNLLEWSKLQARMVYINPTAFDLQKLFEETEQQISLTALQKNVAILHDLEPDIEVFADKNMISTVLRNLLSNAIKFSYPGGVVSVSGKTHPDGVVISFRDEGTGVDPGQLDKLFVAGENHSRKGTRNEQGTGLGLLLCRELMEQHGGRIWAENNPVTGSTFHILIPPPLDVQRFISLKQ